LFLLSINETLALGTSTPLGSRTRNLTRPLAAHSGETAVSKAPIRMARRLLEGAGDSVQRSPQTWPLDSRHT
jgi:hypothetical protein